MRAPRNFWQTESKECPFCGKNPEIETNFLNRFNRERLKCTNRRCFVKPMTQFYRTYNRKTLIRAWNRRVNDYPKEKPAPVDTGQAPRHTKNKRAE